jgi:exonuclease SbcD
MRLLHTSDWHLGRSLHRADLRPAQEAFLDHLVDTVREERVAVVLVSGDVYDRAVPSLDAVALCEDALLRLRSAGARVVLISGNHDSARRLGFGSGLVDAAGVHLRTRADRLAEPVLVEDDAGPVAIYAVPYLEPDAVRSELPGEAVQVPGRGHRAVLDQAMNAVRADRRRRGGPRSVVLAHAWVSGGAGCDSERDISVGGVGVVPAATFAGVDYVALGHLHGPQVLAPGLRYSGSPVPYSFSEAGHGKGSWLVELGEDGLVGVRSVPAPVFRRLSVLRGELDDLLTDRRHDGRAGDFVAVTLTDPVRQHEAMERLRRRFPHVLTLAWEPAGVESDPRSYRARVSGRSDLGLAEQFVHHVRRSPVTGAERTLLEQAFTAVRRAESADADTLLPDGPAPAEPATPAAVEGRQPDVASADDPIVQAAVPAGDAAPAESVRRRGSQVA